MSELSLIAAPMAGFRIFDERPDCRHQARRAAIFQHFDPAEIPVIPQGFIHVPAAPLIGTIRQGSPGPVARIR